jgi:hypothetical protein
VGLLNGLANTGDLAMGLMTALDLLKPSVNDLHGLDAQMVLTLKITLVLKEYQYECSNCTF